MCAGRDALAMFLIPHSILIAALRDGDGWGNRREEGEISAKPLIFDSRQRNGRITIGWRAGGAVRQQLANNFSYSVCCRTDKKEKGKGRDSAGPYAGVDSPQPPPSPHTVINIIMIPFETE